MYRETKRVKNNQNAKRVLTRFVPGGMLSKLSLVSKPNGRKNDFLATKMLDSQKYFYPAKTKFFTKTIFVSHSE